MRIKRSPEQTLNSAQQSVWLLGVVWLALATIFLCAGLRTMTLRGLALWLMLFAVPASVLLVMSGQIRKRRQWAVITALVIACLAAAEAGILLLTLAVTAPGLGALGFIVVLAVLFGIAAFAILYCAQALRQWRHLVDTPQGFAPVMKSADAPIAHADDPAP